ncbi:zinc carboxypeptidase [Actinopolyspora erythraea]|uniref:Zinc carboxypeptidase n=1 Tax=Actinopolyspora erythraea TaxID=414996 RepID=A0A099D6Y9_9ACTN|nr:zinc carboxypeptidase [Actinopolyspora erythraea]KGI81794.1 carboxypeptidase [Actinopolyspora erythraea]
MYPLRRRTVTALSVTTLLFVLPVTQSATADPVTAGEAEPDSARAVYRVPETDPASRTAVNRTGALVLSVDEGTAFVTATPEQAERLRSRGMTLHRVADGPTQSQSAPARPAEFPPEDSGYHTYSETLAEIEEAATDHPGIVDSTSAGSSARGRDIPVVKISDRADVDEAEPEVLFTCNQHAREHLTAEMCLHILRRYTDGYGSNPGITEAVDNREIWIIPMVNPDGATYDVAGADYRGWRRNRQSTPVDLNRNWGYRWGCCGGSSGDPSQPTYRGPAPFSAPEIASVRDFVESRVVGGRQRITAHIDFHSFSELVLWPYGYTTADTAPGMTREQYRRFAELGNAMADTNGYTPMQSSDLYVTDGSVNDWMWAEHGILSFTFEMYPSGGGLDGFYPPDEVIQRETSRNDEAVAMLLDEAGN